MTPPAPSSFAASDAADDTAQWMTRALAGFGLVFQLSQCRGQLRFTRVSASASQVCGVDAVALLHSAARFTACIHSADRADFDAALQSSAAHGLPWNWEGRILTAGEVKWINIRAVVSQSAADHTVWDGIMLNISHTRRREAALRDMATLLEQSCEVQRQRLARQLQDHLAHALAELGDHLAALPPSDQRQAAWQRARQLAHDCAAITGRVTAQLCPPTLDHGLCAALHALVQDVAALEGVRLTLHCGDLGALEATTARQIFRFVQEALQAVAGLQPELPAELRATRQPGLLSLDLAITAPPARFAAVCQTLRARALLLGGLADCGITPEAGWRIALRVPVAPAQAAAGDSA